MNQADQAEDQAVPVEDDAGEDDDPHRAVAGVLEPFMHQRASDVVIADAGLFAAAAVA